MTITFVQFAVTVKNVRGQMSTHMVNGTTEADARKTAQIQHPFRCIVSCTIIPAAWLVK